MTAITKVGAVIINNDNEKDNCPIVWYDTLKEQDSEMGNIKPWQVVNRLPGINYICRKAPLFRLLTRMSRKLPDIYNFFPKSYVLPQEYSQFLTDRKDSNKKYIYKPDNGSLGCGIVILKPDTKFNYQNTAAVMQEFVESALINNTKFDLRIYALVASIRPLRVYVYRDGVARFCSATNSSDSVFGQITNTAVNRTNPNHVSIEQITKTVTETFQELEKVTNIQKLWDKIDRIIVLTIISSLKILEAAEKKYCPPYQFQRCFQLLGFDILINSDYEPKILEVNYRPSLASDIPKEAMLKIDMLSTLLKIVTPPVSHIEKLNTSTKAQLEAQFMPKKTPPDIIQDTIRQSQGISHYDCIYPTSNSEQMTEYKKAMETTATLSSTIDVRGNIPFMDVMDNSKKQDKQQQSQLQAKSMAAASIIEKTPLSLKNLIEKKVEEKQSPKNAESKSTLPSSRQEKKPVQMRSTASLKSFPQQNNTKLHQTLSTKSISPSGNNTRPTSKLSTGREKPPPVVTTQQKKRMVTVKPLQKANTLSKKQIISPMDIGKMQHHLVSHHVGPTTRWV
ncbi:Tubulin-tyrosine ligase family protein [Trichomonas vaginalis G3]|uniref:Tubulin-tyrosine ligase family protein n=1 Tax=Trichomonas vaginalis (strain ATCC PRA-98 / G3) TaxID=412133 RepID=A2DV90_TRIV3|nr:positive regulation of cilium movement [Trichomonas vaginalis G3]EAY15686.1 Tubulin-tyrosine ligase family protein [Trichomonas vaginalis G3]KAI5504560.1 positive regulation of cilium movement [Trichomonas vaginalis G3]|eukprot:XP_001327909.1 Tubulin-tyrosine ligase family protein [Trichomonas vaginalis G3]